MPDAIIKMADGTYHVYVLIQDGTEFCGVHKNLKDAKGQWVAAQKILNGAKKKSTDVKVIKHNDVQIFFDYWRPNKIDMEKLPYLVDNKTDNYSDSYNPKWTTPWYDQYSKPKTKKPKIPKKPKKPKKIKTKKVVPKKPEIITPKKKIELDLD